MSYSAPSFVAVDFHENGYAYTAPTNLSVDFQDAPPAGDPIGNVVGSLRVVGVASAYTNSLSVSGAVSTTGLATAYVNLFSAVGYASAVGQATVLPGRLASVSAAIQATGAATAFVNLYSVDGKLGVSGLASVYTNMLYGYGYLSVSGEATFLPGRIADVSGVVQPFIGSAKAASGTACNVAGSISAGGHAVAQRGTAGSVVGLSAAIGKATAHPGRIAEAFAAIVISGHAFGAAGTACSVEGGLSVVGAAKGSIPINALGSVSGRVTVEGLAQFYAGTRCRVDGSLSPSSHCLDARGSRCSVRAKLRPRGIVAASSTHGAPGKTIASVRCKISMIGSASVS